MLRRLVLVGFLVLMSGSMLQIILGTVFSTVFLLIQVQSAPYVSAFDDQIAAVGSFCLVVLFLCEYAFKDAALVDLPEVKAQLSKEQTRIYVLNPLVLSVILIGALAGTLIVSLHLFYITFRQERARMRREARAAKARRLRYLSDDTECMLATLPPLQAEIARIHPTAASNPTYSAVLPRHGPFHVFLSHNWKHGQSEMRIISSRLKEMLPDVSIFLDVDFLGGGSDYPHIDVSDYCLCYLTQKWFTNAPCICEIVRAMIMRRPLIAVLEPDTSDQRGGHTEEECREILLSAKFAADCERFMGARVAKWAEDWARADVRLPTGQEIVDALFEKPAIVWYRLSDFQVVSMRLIAERLLSQSAVKTATPLAGEGQADAALRAGLSQVAAATKFPSSAPSSRSSYTQIAYMEGEIEQQMKKHPVKLPPVRKDCKFHMYCSPFSPGDGGQVAKDIALSLQKLFLPTLMWTSEPEHLHDCEHMALPASSYTWTRGEASDALAHEVCEAMRMGVHVIICHEVPGARLGDREARGACSFEELIATTPKHLCDAGIYNEIAMNMNGDEWRTAGLAKTAVQLAKGSGTREQWRRQPVEPGLMEDGEGGGSATTLKKSVKRAKLLAKVVPLDGPTS